MSMHLGTIRAASVALLGALALTTLGAPTLDARAGAGPAATACAAARFQARSFDLRPLAWYRLFPHRAVRRLTARPPVDSDGVPMRRWTDGRLYYSPSALTFDALRRLNAYVRTRDAAYLDLVVRIARKLRAISTRTGDEIWLPFPYDNDSQGLEAPWYNALAQGTALALFSRLHRLLGRPEDLAFARGLFESLAHRRDRTGPWVGWVDRSSHLWFEHYPGGRRGKILNAHLYVVFGLRDYWQEDPRPDARCLLEGAITTMRDRADRYRRPGTFSWYSLRNRVAHRAYHRYHIRQLRAMAWATGDGWFADLARRFVQDYSPPPR